MLVEKDPTDEILSEILEVQLGLNFEADKEEMYWAQRAHLNWIQYGDRNTSFFHRVTMARHNRNRIHGLEDDSGQWVTGTEKMLRIAMKYFENLFTASDVEGDDRVLGLVEKQISRNMNDKLLQPCTKEDIWLAVKSMAPLKAPGPDGFSTLFFQRYWHIIGDEVASFCMEFLNGRREMGDLNKTHIVLIPKVDKPKDLSQFGPISLCNVLYKIIATAIVVRMSPLLGSCIDEAQGTFIPGRQMSDNTLIAYEVIRSLKMREKGK